MKPMLQCATVVGFQMVLLLVVVSAVQSLTVPRGAAPVEWEASAPLLLDETLP